MRICHVSFGHIKHADPRKWLQSIRYYTVILEATARQHEVHSVHYSYEGMDFLEENVHYHFITPFLTEKVTAQSVRRVITEIRPDVIVLHGMHDVLRTFAVALSQKRRPILIQHHGERPFQMMKSYLHSVTDRLIDGYLFTSRQMGLEWCQKGLIGSPQKIFELMEATSAFDRKHVCGKSRPKLNFLWVGRLNWNKDPIMMVDAFIGFLKIYPEAKLSMIFTGRDLLEKVKMQVTGKESSIRLIGEVPHNQMPDFYRAASFIVSTSRYEGSGVAVLEAMSCGCIPILTNIHAFESMTDHRQVGLSFESGSVVSLIKALMTAAQMDIVVERKKVTDQFVSNLSPTPIAQKMITIFDQVVRKVRV